MIPEEPSAPSRGIAAPMGPGAGHRPAASLAAGLALLAVACAGGRGGAGPAQPPAGPEPRIEEPAAERAPSAALERARSLLDTRPRRSLRLADSLYFRLRARPGAGVAAPLRLQAQAALATGDTAGAVARLRELLAAFPDSDAARGAPLLTARLLRAVGDDPGAVAVLLDHGEGADGSLSLMREAARSMSLRELAAARERAGDGEPRALLLAELALARARSGDPGSARRAARRALASDPAGPDRATARRVLDGRVEARSGPVRVGLAMPDSGRLASVGRWVRRGVRIALDEEADLPPVELVQRDLSGEAPGPATAGLASAGVVAVIGPVRSRGLAEAAAARPGVAPVVVSPTATRARRGVRNAYALWDRSRRELDAAAVLGRWVGGRLRPGAVGAVYPEGELGRRAFLRFRRAVGEGRGGWLVASAGYDPGATTLEGPISEVSSFRPDAVYAAASGTSSLLQMAPQLSYYGVRAAVVVGGPDWTRPGAVRRLDPVFTQYRVGAAFDAPARDAFRASYERRYRSTLGDNVLPMLGHDAALLVRRAAARTRPPRPRAVARALAGLSGVAGATGRLTPDAGSGTVARRVELRALEERRLRPTDGASARSWLRSAGRLQTAGARGRRARALRAVRNAEIPLESPSPEADQGGDDPR